MKKRRFIIALTALLILAAQTPSYARSGSLKECRALAKSIEQYAELRRKGGRAARMDKWKRQLRQSEERFRQLDCGDYGDELKHM